MKNDNNLRENKLNYQKENSEIDIKNDFNQDIFNTNIDDYDGDQIHSTSENEEIPVLPKNIRILIILYSISIILLIICITLSIIIDSIILKIIFLILSCIVFYLHMKLS